MRKQVSKQRELAEASPKLFDAENLGIPLLGNTSLFSKLGLSKKVMSFSGVQQDFTNEGFVTISRVSNIYRFSHGRGNKITFLGSDGNEYTYRLHCK